MTKKYKHKQTGDLVETVATAYYKNVTNSLEAYIPAKYIENSCDWEEVVEKDYEILSFVYGDDWADPFKLITEGTHKGKFKRSTNVPSPFLNDSMHHIHSIKRLSDGCVFTVGDKIVIGGRTRTLESFKLVDTILYIVTDSGKDMWSKIQCWEKPKQPLFTTEDGVDIFKGDMYYGVFIGSSYELKYWKASLGSKQVSSVKDFFSKEKAEEYILMNKPCLSINDVAKVYKTANQFPVDRPKAQGNLLKELTKSKL